ncbi:hypothetical protein RHO14_12730 [Orbus wheelerorum]|uniref:hypothetical protein n=1 Tax=Orbus wheelerorum TaxID=3074111 RepID=UPI00370DDA13
MKILKKLSITLVAILLLSACSSSSNNKPEVETNTLANPSTEGASDTSTVNSETRYENGIGETQIERYKMLVLPTQVNLTTQNTFPVSPSSLSNTLSHEITTALYETHRFDILANEDPSTNGLDNTMPQFEDANFYLQSTLNQLDTQETVRILKATGQGVEEKTVIATILYQIIDAKSHKVIFSHSLNYQLKSTTNNETFGTTINNTLKSMANLIKNEIINEIYPIRILTTKNNEAILDYPLTVDSQCQVMRLGKKIKDSYTDSLLGYEQNIVGKLLITRATGVLSYAQVISGEATTGDICKPIQTAIISAQELVKRTPQGGVVLPFD